jgi:hypothetical protein
MAQFLILIVFVEYLDYRDAPFVEIWDNKVIIAREMQEFSIPR